MPAMQLELDDRRLNAYEVVALGECKPFNLVEDGAGGDVLIVGHTTTAGREPQVFAMVAKRGESFPHDPGDVLKLHPARKVIRLAGSLIICRP